MSQVIDVGTPIVEAQLRRFQLTSDSAIDYSFSQRPLNLSYFDHALIKDQWFGKSIHKHKSFERKIYKTQEAWFLYEGKIVAEFFDIDNKKVAERVFKKGDLISIFNGGHCFQITENSIFLEFKNGPYFGKEIDREDI